MATAGVDFFRVDRTGPTKRLLAIAGALVTIGATSIGAHLVHRLEPGVAHFVSLAGGLTVAVGLILGFGAMAMMIFENVYLLIRQDGVVCHDNGKETTIPWDELEEVRLEEESGIVVLERKGGEPLRWFAGKEARLVRDKVAEAKRKAVHGLLRQD